MPAFVKGALLLGILGGILIVASANETAASVAQGILIMSIVLLLVSGDAGINVLNWFGTTSKGLATKQ